MLLVFYFLFRNVWSAGPFSVSFVLMGIFLFIVLDPLSFKKKKKKPWCPAGVLFCSHLEDEILIAGLQRNINGVTVVQYKVQAPTPVQCF